MELIETATVTSKGQLTVPVSIREIFKLEKGSTVIFKITDKGVLFMPGEIMAKDSYTQEEWGKIERLVAERGKAYKSARSARNHIKSL
jgi:AbrB family looped-hinge helix DNA binding protein